MTTFHGLDYEPVVYDESDPFDWAQPYDPRHVDTDLDVDDFNALNWMQTAPVQAALAELGQPDGTDDWTYEFARHLLGYVDAVEQITANDDLTMRVALEAVSTWNWHLAELSGTLGFKDGWSAQREQVSFWRHMPKDIPRLLLTHTIAGRTMTFGNCAWLLGVTTSQLEECLWSRQNRTALYFAAETMECDPNNALVDVARQHGVNRSTLSEYLLLRRGIKTNAGKSVMSDETMATVLRWMADGMAWTEAYALCVEAGMCPADYRARSFHRRVMKHVRAAA